MESKNREKKFRPWRYIRFFGDSELNANDIVMWFFESHEVCDFSECGLYIASKRIENGEKFREIRLKDLLEFYEYWTPVFADGDRIAIFFRENDIKTLQELIVTLLLKDC